jgi:hypothetical protein
MTTLHMKTSMGRMPSSGTLPLPVVWYKPNVARRVIDLVTEDNEGGVLKLLHGEEGVELGFGFVEALVVFCVDQEDDAGDFRDCLKLY